MKHLYKFLSLLPACFMLSVIFLFSAQTGTESGSLSGEIAVKVVTTLHPDLSLEEASIRAEALQFPIRKMAHATEYFILCLTFIWPLWTHGLRGRKLFLTAVFLSFLAASGDEYHQSFVPGRGPSFRDVLIDTSGASIAALVLFNIKKNHVR